MPDIEVENRRREIHEELAKILKAHQNLESNIPVNDSTAYWSLKNELNGLPKTTPGHPQTE